MTSVQEMKRHLSMYVKKDMFGGVNLPPKTNKIYYPRIRAIRNHMLFERPKLKKSLIDKEALNEKVFIFDQNAVVVQTTTRTKTRNVKQK